MTGHTRIRVLRMIARMNTGGPARQVAAMARGLDPERFEHRLLVGQVGPGEADDLELRGIPVEHVRVRGLGRAPSPFDDARAWAAIAAEIRRFRPHVVHTHTAKAGVLGRTAALATGGPGGRGRSGRGRPALVHTFHGHLLHGYFSPILTRAVVGVERALARASDRLVAVGARVRDELLATGVGRPDQYLVVPPGVELGPVPSRSVARCRLGLPADAPVIAYVGRLVAVKRPDRFVAAAASVARDHPDAVFLVAGDGPEAAATREAARAAGLGGRVRFLGWWADVETLYAAADAVVVTSDNEGMPVSLIEAALAGRPAVTTDAGSAGEVVADGETGWVVPRDAAAVAHAVRRLLADPARAAAMGAAAADRARRLYSAERLVADLSALYEALA